MTYDELTLRPHVGAVDVAAVNAWLAKQPFAFFDPVSQDAWHLSATAEDMQRHHAERIADPLRYPTGVRVLVSVEQVIVVTGRAFTAEPRALELVAWLVRDRSWTVQRDQSSPEPVGDPRRLFPIGIDAHDHTLGALTEGVRVEWTAGDHTLIVHSTGQWRSSGWIGSLSPSALAEWTTVIEPLLGREGVFREYVEASTTSRCLELETPDDFEVACFDAAHTPEALRSIVALLDRWLALLATWTVESTSPELERVRSA